MCVPELAAPDEPLLAAVPLGVAVEAAELALRVPEDPFALEAADAVPDVAATVEVPAIKLANPSRGCTGNNRSSRTSR
jgi:hypothetical protein